MRTRLVGILGFALAALGTMAAIAMLLTPVPARAIDYHDIENALDASGALPIQFSAINGFLDNCYSDPNLVGCIENSGIDVTPDMLRMINIYVDIRAQDWGDLLTDAGTEAFCVVMQLITDVPICDSIQYLEAVGNEAGKIINGLLGETNAVNANAGVGNGGAPTTAYVCPDGTPTSWPDGRDCPPTRICPVGQAMQNGTCGICPATGGTDLSQSADKRSWTKTYWTQSGAAAPDGSHCIQNGTGNVNVWNCAIGQFSPQYGQCAPACAIGSVADPSTGACHVCSDNTQAVYTNPAFPMTNSVGMCQGCPHGMLGKLNGAVCACPSGYGQANANAECEMCSANSYANFGTCSPCGDTMASQPGSNSCKELSCPAGSHVALHACLPNASLLPPQPSGTRAGPAFIPKGCVAGTHKEGANCVQDSLTPESTAPAKNPCPILSRWTGTVCVGPRGRSFCPEGLTMRDRVCVR